MPTVTITRLARFSAAHRLHNPAFSDEENRRIFGKCNSPNYHGHNYTIEVTIGGTPDAATGYVILVHIGGPSIDADSGIQDQSERQKNSGNPGLGQACVLGQA